MATSALEVVIRGRDLLTPTLNKVQSGLRSLGATADGLKGGVLAGIGLGAGIGAFTLAQTAVSKFNDVLADSVQRALDDEASIKRLTVALRDNAPAWDGSLTKVDAFVKRGQELAFTDDALRDSITKLAASTGDVGRAMALSSTAMDLARLRGIDLSTATDMIAKAQAGNIGALRRVLPWIDKNATATEALAAIQKAAAGQAEAYAAMAEGRLVRAQIVAGEAMERLGYTLLPTLARTAGEASDALEVLSFWMDQTGKSGGEAAAGTSFIDTAIRNSLQGMGPLVAAFNEWTLGLKASREAAAATAAAVGDEQAAMRLAREEAAKSVSEFDGYTGALGRISSSAEDSASNLEFLRVQMNLNLRTSQIANATSDSATRAALVRSGAIDRAAEALARERESQKQTTVATTAGSGATDRQTAALNRLLAAIQRVDDAQQTLFERQIKNLDAVIQKQVDAIDAARAARDEERQAAQDARDLKAARAGLSEAARSGSADAIAAAQQNLADVRARIEERQTRKHEDELKKQLKATMDYIDAVAQLESNATNRKALANTLSKREKVLEAQRAAALAAGDTDSAAQIDMKLEAIRAAEKRNQEAMDNAKAKAKVQDLLTVHTVINLDGKVIADVVDKYLGRRV